MENFQQEDKTNKQQEEILSEKMMFFFICQQAMKHIFNVELEKRSQCAKKSHPPPTEFTHNFKNSQQTLKNKEQKISTRSKYEK